MERGVAPHLQSIPLELSCNTKEEEECNLKLQRGMQFRAHSPGRANAIYGGNLSNQVLSIRDWPMLNSGKMTWFLNLNWKSRAIGSPEGP
jgi:hypothetical protein